jgi:hypothetical protein
MSETQKFRDLVRETMSPESQERAARRTQDLLDALPAAPAERGAESEVPDLAGVLREIADLYVGKDRPHAYGFMLEAAARLASRAAAPGEGAVTADDFVRASNLAHEEWNRRRRMRDHDGARLMGELAERMEQASLAARPSSSPSTTGGET